MKPFWGVRKIEYSTQNRFSMRAWLKRAAILQMSESDSNVAEVVFESFHVEFGLLSGSPKLDSAES